MKKKTLSELLYLTKRAHPFFEQKLGPVSNKIGLSMQEGHVLLFLANNPDCNHACDAVAYRGLSKSYVSKALTSLAKKGYIVFQEDTTDHRYQKIVFTEAAKEKIKILQDGQRALLKELIQGVSKEDMETTDKVLNQIFQNFIKLEEETNV